MDLRAPTVSGTPSRPQWGPAGLWAAKLALEHKRHLEKRMTVTRVRWVRNKDGSDPFAGEEERSRVVRRLRSVVEDALPDLNYKDQGESTVSLPRLHNLVARRRELEGLGTPGETLFYDTFALKRRGETVVNVLTAIGIDRETAKELGEEVETVLGRGFLAARDLPDPKVVSIRAKLVADVRAYREAWDSGIEGTEGYRDPNMSLPTEKPDLLSSALALAMQNDVAEEPQLAEEDVAYCLFSACRHGRDYTTWTTLCSDSKRAAEAMIDLISWENWTSPSLRAAWCLSQFEPSLRAKAVQFAMDRYASAHDGTRELLESIINDQVDQHIEVQVLTESRGDQTWQARAVLEEIHRTPKSRGARGVLNDLGDETSECDGTSRSAGSSSTALEIALLDSRRRYEMKARYGGGYRYFQGEHFARVANAALRQLDEVSDDDRAFLLRGAIFLQCGRGFGIFNFLPEREDTWALPVLAHYLGQNDYRTPRYHAAMILQHLNFPGREQFVRDNLSRSSYKRVNELCEAIISGTVQQFVEDPSLCYDFLPEEGIKRLALKATAVDLRGEYADMRPSTQLKLSHAEVLGTHKTAEPSTSD
jgi:hypothetical protein